MSEELQMQVVPKQDRKKSGVRGSKYDQLIDKALGLDTEQEISVTGVTKSFRNTFYQLIQSRELPLKVVAGENEGEYFIQKLDAFVPAKSKLENNSSETLEDIDALENETEEVLEEETVEA
jgi:hypothetical protein